MYLGNSFTPILYQNRSGFEDVVSNVQLSETVSPSVAVRTFADWVTVSSPLHSREEIQMKMFIVLSSVKTFKASWGFSIMRWITVTGVVVSYQKIKLESVVGSSASAPCLYWDGWRESKLSGGDLHVSWEDTFLLISSSSVCKLALIGFCPFSNSLII